MHVMATSFIKKLIGVAIFIFNNIYFLNDINLEPIRNLELFSEEYGMKISIKKKKSEIMAFKGKEPQRSKIVINNEIIERFNTIRYLGTKVLFKQSKYWKGNQKSSQSQV